MASPRREAAAAASTSRAHSAHATPHLAVPDEHAIAPAAVSERAAPSPAALEAHTATPPPAAASARPPRLFYGWVVWFVLLLGQCTVFLGASSCVTFIIEGVRADVGISQSSVAFAYTLGTVFSAFAQIPIGRTVDRWGGRVAVTVYSAAFSLSVFCLSLPTSWIQLAAAFFLLRALGVGGLELACNTCLQHWFARRRGLATGLSQSANAILSYAIISNVVTALVLHFGWRRTYAACGVAFLLVYTPLAWLVVRSSPEDIGLQPDGDRPTAPSAFSGSCAAALPAATPAATPPAATPPAATPPAATPPAATPPAATPPAAADAASWTLKEAACTRCFVLLASSNALAWGVGSGIFFNLASIATSSGLSSALLAPCLYVPWAVCRAISMAVAGYLLDKLPPRKLLSAGLLLSSTGVLVLSTPFGGKLTPQLASLFGILHGLGNGSSALIFKATPAIFFGRRHLGAINGCLSSLNVGSTAIGPLLLSASFDLLGSYALCLRAIALCTGLFGLLALSMHAPRKARDGAAISATAPAPEGTDTEAQPATSAAEAHEIDGESSVATSLVREPAEPFAPIKTSRNGPKFTRGVTSKKAESYSKLDDD